jgi:hypothetical protein
MSAVTRHIYFTVESWDILNDYAETFGLTPSTAIRQLIDTSIDTAGQIETLTRHRDALGRRANNLAKPFKCRCGNTVQHPDVL